MPMVKELTIQTIRQAQAGNMQGLSEVSEQVRQKVSTYIHRLTLDYHVTEDLTQETVLEMIKALPQLKVLHINGFWAWIFRTALGKVQHHYRIQGGRRLAQKTTSDDTVLESCEAEDSNPENTVIRKEIRNAAMGAMKAVKFKYRNILILRCFDNLPYNQIAVILDVNELQARQLFFRAKHSLKGQLQRHGFKRDSLLAGLTIFASLTLRTPKKAAAKEIVLASSLETPIGAALAGLVTVKTIAIGICALLVTGFTASMIKPESSTNPVLQELYGHLYPLLESEEFVTPSRVIAVHDPKGDGFLIVDQHKTPVRQRQADQIPIDLVNQPRMALVLPKAHWIELGFDGPIQDGPGPDLLLKIFGCRMCRVFLTDGKGQLFELPPFHCVRRGVCGKTHVIAYDLKGLDLPFEPSAVRILGVTIPWSRNGGIHFALMLAHIQ
jgi:RNA polymerase sigma-70 factor (ECF subfamily)